MEKDIERLHERIDKLYNFLNENLGAISTKLERHLAKNEVIGSPGEAPACKVHRDRLDSLDREFEEIFQRIHLLEKTKIKYEGFTAGVAFVWSFIGAAILLAAQYLIRKFS